LLGSGEITVIILSSISAHLYTPSKIFEKDGEKKEDKLQLLSCNEGSVGIPEYIYS